MGAALDLLHHLRGAGLVLTLTPTGGLHVAPRTALTDDHRAAIRANLEELVLALQAQAEQAPAAGAAPTSNAATAAEGTSGEALREAFEERAAILEFDAGMSRAEAEAAAWVCVDAEQQQRRERRAATPATPRIDAAGAAQTGQQTGHRPITGDAAAQTASRKPQTARRAVSTGDAAAHRMQAWAWPPDLVQATLARLRARAADDDRRLCVECRAYDPRRGRCTTHRRADLYAADVGRDLATTLQRCRGFVDAVTP